MISRQESVSEQGSNSVDVVCRIEIMKGDGYVLVFEALNNHFHGKRTFYYGCGDIGNEIYRNGDWIADKTVK